MAESTRTVSTPDSDRILEEHKIRIRDVDIHYIKVGDGGYPLLFLHGFMGTALIDFGKQLKGLSVENRTMIAWDAPGCGKSRPPEKVISDGYSKRDATYARDMMIALGYSTFTIVAWCNGGFTAMELAAMYPENVRRLIVYGAKAYYAQSDIDSIRKITLVQQYPEWRQVQLKKYYSIEYLNRMWDMFMNHIEKTFRLTGDICMEALPKIRCPTLILHGDKDKIVAVDHGFYLKDHIPGSKLKILNNSGHSAQITQHEMFNDVLEEFLGEDIL